MCQHGFKKLSGKETTLFFRWGLLQDINNLITEEPRLLSNKTGLKYSVLGTSFHQIFFPNLIVLYCFTLTDLFYPV